MKKFAVMMIALMLAILAIVPVTFASAEAARNDLMYVSCPDGKMLNLRAEPNTNSRVLARMGNGKTLTVLGRANASWLKVSVRIDGKTVKGYVNDFYVSANDPALAPQEFHTVTRFKVTAAPSNGAGGHVNLRAKASTSSTILAYLYKGDVLTVIAESNAYYQVRTANGVTGYVVKCCVNK